MKKIDLILETLKEIETSDGITTSTLSNYLKMERSNVSKISNELVASGEVRKNSSRPVKYFLKSPGMISFNSISGLDKLVYLYPSLNEAIKLAKTSIEDNIFRNSFIMHFNLVYERMTFFKNHTIDLKDKLKNIDEWLYNTSLNYQSILEDCLNLYFAPCESTFIVIMAMYVHKFI